MDLVDTEQAHRDRRNMEHRALVAFAHWEACRQLASDTPSVDKELLLAPWACGDHLQIEGGSQDGVHLGREDALAFHRRSMEAGLHMALEPVAVVVLVAAVAVEVEDLVP